MEDCFLDAPDVTSSLLQMQPVSDPFLDSLLQVLFYVFKLTIQAVTTGDASPADLDRHLDAMPLVECLLNTWVYSIFHHRCLV